MLTLVPCGTFGTSPPPSIPLKADPAPYVLRASACLWQIVSQLPPHIVVARSVLVLLRDFGEVLPCVPQPILLYLCQVGPRASFRPSACVPLALSP